MRLVFIRHGDPDYEHDSLTPRGRKEAEALVPRVAGLNADAFYCSPLGRAKLTAEPSMKFLGREAEIVPWLEEFNAPVLDPYSGNIRCAWNLPPKYWTNDEMLYSKDDWTHADIMRTGRVESRFKEICASMDEVIKQYGYVRRPGSENIYDVISPNTKTIVFFCHMGVSLVLMSHLFGISGACMWQNFCPLPSSVSMLRTEECDKGIAVFRTAFLGDVSHLYAAGIEPSFSGFANEIYP